jgi:ATP-dependent Clp protease ATP-binding subunit ClpC
VVDFRNTVLIMTSPTWAPNTSAEEAAPWASLSKRRLDRGERQEEHDKIEKALKSTFRPEFLNRIDEIIMFSPLSEELMLQIVDLEMREVSERLGEHGIHVQLSEEARSWLAKEGYDPAFWCASVEACATEVC